MREAKATLGLARHGWRRGGLFQGLLGERVDDFSWIEARSSFPTAVAAPEAADYLGS